MIGLLGMSLVCKFPSSVFLGVAEICCSERFYGVLFEISQQEIGSRGCGVRRKASHGKVGVRCTRPI